jgi:hypothetical protein
LFHIVQEQLIQTGQKKKKKNKFGSMLERFLKSQFVNLFAPQGEAAFTNLSGVFYPAVSFNRNAAVTIHTALDPPSNQGSDSEGQ